MVHKSVYLLSRILFLSTLVLLVAGGLVTSTGSGLSVPDWPLSYGQLFPPMVGGIRFEHSHRMIAGTVGVITLIFFILACVFDHRVWFKKLAGVGLVAVVLQAILGAITVLYFLPKLVSVSHACLAQSFFSLTLLMVYFTSREWFGSAKIFSVNAISFHRLAGVVTLIIFVQLILGAFTRHSGHQDPIIIGHYVFAAIVFLGCYALLFQTAQVGIAGTRNPLFGHAVFLSMIVSLQVFLGLAAFLFVRMQPRDVMNIYQICLTVGHQSLGAVLLAASVLFTARAHRLIQTP